MIRGMLWVSGCVCSVALAAAPLPVYANEWIGSQSDIVGSFGDDNANVNDIYNDLIEDLGEVIDFESVDQDNEEDNTSDIDRDSETSDEDLLNDLTDQYNNEIGYSDFVHEIQSNELDPDLDIDNNELDLIDPLSNYTNYYGAISSTYLEYMRGFLPKLGFRDHYVAARTGQYEYIFAYGDLEYTGTLFRGSNIKVISFNTYNNGTYSFGVQSSFNINPSSYMLYSDLSDFYPSLTDSAGFTSRQILILLTIMGLVWTIDHMYQVRKIRRLK